MTRTSEQSLFLNRYLFGKELAEGGSARVFRVKDTWFPDQPLVAKIQRDDDPRLGRALQREFATLLLHAPINAPFPRLLHRCHTPVCVAEQEFDGLILVENEVLGLEWHQWLDTTPTHQEILHAIATLLHSLHGLHLSGLRHGDIKPDNILVPQGAPGQAAWIDFGLSDRPGILHGGTPKYLAPEALNGAPELASDLYALGKILEEVPGPIELRSLATALTTWNPNERATCAQALERVQALLGETEAPSHQTPINPWALWPESLAVVTSALQTRRTLALHIEDGSEQGAEHWVKAAAATAIKQGWEHVSRDAIESSLARAEENPSIEDAAHFVLTELSTMARSTPIVVDVGERIAQSPVDHLSLRLSRDPNAYPGILWLTWGCESGLPAWEAEKVSLPKWDEHRLTNLVSVYRPGLVQPHKVARRLLELTNGEAGTASRMLWKHQVATEPELWNLRRESSKLPASVTKLVLALSRQPLSPSDVVEITESFQSPRQTEGEFQELILNAEVQSKDGGESFTLIPSAFLKLNIDVSLSDDRLASILPEIIQPLPTPLLSSQLAWKAHVSLVDLLESAKFHYARQEWELSVQCFQAARDANADFQANELELNAKALVRNGQAGTAIAILEGCREPSLELYRANLLLEQGLVHEAHVAISELVAKFPSPSASLKLSRLKLRLGEFNQAEAIVAELESELTAEEEIEKACILGLVSMFRGDARAAKNYLEPLLDQETQTPELQGKLTSSLALVYQKSGKSDRAKALYLRAIAHAEETYSTKVLLNRLTNLGTLEQDMSDYSSAAQTYKRSMVLAKTLNDHSALLRSGLNLANLQSILGQVNEARSTLASLELVSQESQFKTERSYIALLCLDLELLESALPKDFGKRVRALANDLDGLGLQTAHEESRLLELKAEAFFAPSPESIEAIITWTRTQLEANRKSLATQGYLALIRALSSFGALSEQDAAIDFLIERIDSSPHLELEWSVKVLHALKLNQERQFAQASELWVQAREAYQKLNQTLPQGLQQSFFQVAPRDNLLRQQQEQVSIHPEGTDRNLPSVARLFQIMRALAQETDTERLLARILDSVVMLSGAERGLLILANKDDHSLNVRVTSGVYEHETETKAFSTTIAKRAIEALQPIKSGNLQSDGRFNSDHSVHILSLQSTLCLPMHAPPRIKGALYLDHRLKPNAFDDADISVLWAFADQAAIALSNAYIIDELRSQKDKLETTQRELTSVQKQLQEDLAQTHTRTTIEEPAAVVLDGPVAEVGIVTRSKAMLHISQMVTKVATTSLPVTISGESGTGKELIAKAIHRGSSAYESGDFIALNCGAVADGLWESELFGHERGAFTGANREKPGLFELARNGTLFLDEIGDLPLDTQVKLLRVLQQGEFRRVGGHRLLKTNARVVCATHRSLEDMVKAGTFREDLWYRLNVIELSLPPLRDRPEDIPLLVQHFLKYYSSGQQCRLSSEAATLLEHHAWPGNVRELENELQRAIALCDEVIEAAHLSTKVQQLQSLAPLAQRATDNGALGPLKPQVESFERHYISRMLEACNGNRTQAAKALGLTRPGFYKKLKTLGIN